MHQPEALTRAHIDPDIHSVMIGLNLRGGSCILTHMRRHSPVRLDGHRNRGRLTGHCNAGGCQSEEAG